MNTITGQDAAAEALFFLTDMIRYCSHKMKQADKMIAAGMPFKAADATDYAVDAFNAALEHRETLIKATAGKLTAAQAAACDQALALHAKVSDLCERRIRACHAIYQHG